MRRTDGPTPAAAEAFHAEARLACELGFDATFMTTVPSVGGPGICFHEQARFHPRRYLAGVAAALSAAGGRIFEHSEAEEFRDAPLAVKANGHWVACQDIVMATHNPLVGVASMASATVFQTKLSLYTSYVVGGPGAARHRAGRTLLGHRQSLPLRPARVAPQSRSADRGRRGSQDRAGGDTRGLLRSARAGARRDACRTSSSPTGGRVR